MPLSAFPDDELSALLDVGFFERKAAATRRMMEAFAGLREALKPELPVAGWLCAGAVDVERGHLAGGENYRGLPYVVLDFPRYFTRDEFLTMRTMFWWGHYVVFSLVLKGPWLPDALDRIRKAGRVLEAATVEVSVADDPWDWRRGAGFTRPLRAAEGAADLTPDAHFVKLLRFLPLDSPRFSPDGIVSMGLETWHIYAALVGKQPDETATA